MLFFLDKFILVLKYAYACVFVFGYVEVSAGAYGGQSHWMALELGLQAVESCLTWGQGDPWKNGVCCYLLSHLSSPCFDFLF